jgi:hypothetical protein
MSHLNDNERLHLDKMLKEFDAEDNTNKIRELRHSYKIRDNIERLNNLKKKYTRLRLTDKSKFEELVISHCNFLWSNYTNIFNRLMKDEMDINILYSFINKLKEIEDGEIDQHEASVEVGKILKRLYVDSALRREKNYDAKNKTKTKTRRPVNKMTWSQYKAANS